MPLQTRLVTFLKVLFSLPGDILDEVILENAAEEQALLERLQAAPHQQATHDTAE